MSSKDEHCERVAVQRSAVFCPCCPFTMCKRRVTRASCSNRYKTLSEFVRLLCWA